MVGFTVEEQKFVGTADGSNVTAISTPVNGNDERVVLGALAKEFVVGGIVDVDLVVVRTYSEFLSIWGVLNGFNPLLRISICGNDLI